MRDENIVMTLLESLSVSYEYLITTIETMPMKKLMIEYVMTRLMYELLKCKEPHDEDIAMMLRQNKGGNSFLRQRRKIVFLL